MMERALGSAGISILCQDARLSMSYRLRGEPALPCPVHAWGGDRDETVTGAQLDGWRAYAGGGFHRRQFPGDHYFHLTRPEEILPALRGVLCGGTKP